MKNNKYYNNYIGMILSYQCNLKCKYCYIPTKKDLTLTLKTAQEILTPYLSLADADEIEIDFMGAEPLTAFERLKEIIEWVKAQHFERKYFFFATTNGTLLTKSMKQWFVENKDIVILGLSYDGTDESQDKNRSHSSKAIDMQFFLDTWPEQAFKCTISEQSVPSLADGIIRLAEVGASINANSAYEEGEWSESSISEYGRQLARLVDYYTNNPDKPIAGIIDYDLVSIYYSRDQKQGPNCGAAKGEGFYDVDGHSYPCQMLSPLVIVRQEALEIQTTIKNTDINYADHKCDDCILKNHCPTCMAKNYIYRNDFSLRDVTHCRLTRLEVLATCALQKNLLLSKNEHSDYEVQLAKAICEIYNNLQ